MAKMTAKQLAAWERTRDMNAELREMIGEMKQGAPAWARRTDFTPQKNGTIRRRVVRNDGTVEKDELIPAAKLSIAAARAGTGLSQGEFAKLLGVSVRTLQAWEQGRREPSGAAQTLLRIAATHPSVVREAAAG